MGRPCRATARANRPAKLMVVKAFMARCVACVNPNQMHRPRERGLDIKQRAIGAWYPRTTSHLSMQPWFEWPGTRGIKVSISWISLCYCPMETITVELVPAAPCDLPLKCARTFVLSSRRQHAGQSRLQCLHFTELCFPGRGNAHFTTLRRVAGGLIKAPSAKNGGISSVQ